MDRSTPIAGGTRHAGSGHTRELAYALLQIAAIEAIAAGRYDEATAALITLTADALVTPGRCRYCGCTRGHACAIAVPVPPDPVALADPLLDLEPMALAACRWADNDETVCTNFRCLERWRAEAGDIVHTGHAHHASASRIVRP